jgi:uncharacterized protein (TIGR03118 family)
MTMGVGAAARAQDEPPTRFIEHDLVSDVPGQAEITDANLVNAWGMSQSPTSPIWVSDNGPNVSTLYRTDGANPVTKVGLTVSIPGDGVTGQVFNPTTGFEVSAGGATRASVFIFDTESGDVAGWNPNVPRRPVSVDRPRSARTSRARLQGLAMVQDAAGAHLLAADFHGGQIVVFDSTWQQVQLSGSFTDPDLPAGYGPFNVATLGGQVYVAYAKQDADHKDEIAGQGRGFVDVFDVSGNFLRRLASHGQLNAPWGLALAPGGFGDLAGSLLVGNFGDGGSPTTRDRRTGASRRRASHRDRRPLPMSATASPPRRRRSCSRPAGRGVARPVRHMTAAPPKQH